MSWANRQIKNDSFVKIERCPRVSGRTSFFLFQKIASWIVLALLHKIDRIIEKERYILFVKTCKKRNRNFRLKNVSISAIIWSIEKLQIPGMFDNPLILNLHLRLWDSYIAGWMPSLRLQWKAVRSVAVTHLALARRQNSGNGILGLQKKKSICLQMLF